MQTPLQIANDMLDKAFGIRPALAGTYLTTSTEKVRDLIVEAIELEQSQHDTPTVVIRGGQPFHGDDVDVIDLDFLSQAGAGPSSEMDQDDIDTIVERLRGAGWHEAAESVLDWWTA